MGGFRPVGSEKLQGMEKINRIMQIARYNEKVPQNVNESTSVNYSVELADGNTYQIEKEKSGYIIKRKLNESHSEYISPMKNREYYNSYSHALKKLNFMAKELNMVNENSIGTNIFENEIEERQKNKYFLKYKKSEMSEQGGPAPKPKPAAPVAAPAPAPAPPAPVPAPEPGMESTPSPEMGTEMGADMGTEETTDTETTDFDFDQPDSTESEPSGDEEVVTYKSIQKMVGKLTQKIRQFSSEDEEAMTADNVKWVINSVLSSLDLNKLSDDDIDDILSKLEGNEEDSDFDDDFSSEEGIEDTEESRNVPEDEMEFDMSKLDLDSSVRPQIPTPPSGGEMTETMDLGRAINKSVSMKHQGSMMDKMGELDEFEDLEIDVCDHCNGSGHDETRDAMCDWCEGTGEKQHIKHGARKNNRTFKKSRFMESTTVDSIISKYFDNTGKDKNRIQQLSESVSQEKNAIKLMEKYPHATFMGKTNKNNLIFRTSNREFKITPKGNIL